MKKYMEAWVDHELVIRGRQASGVERYRRTLKIFINWLEGNGMSTEPQAIARGDIDEFQKWLFYSAGNLKNSSRANKLAALRSFFRYLKYIKAIAEDPTENVPSPKISVPSKKIFTDEDLRLIFSMPDRNTEKGFRDFVLLLVLYGSGMRVAELCSLAIEDIVDNGGPITLNILGKGDKQRFRTLKGKIAIHLRNWIAIRLSQGARSSDHIFIRVQGKDRKALGEQAVNNILKKYAGMVGIKSADAFVHKMRTTFCTDLIDAHDGKCPRCGAKVETINVFEVQYAMGHANPKTTQGYYVMSKKGQKKAIPIRRLSELGLNVLDDKSVKPKDPGAEMLEALRVIASTHHIREYLEANDGKVLKQVEAAIGG